MKDPTRQPMTTEDAHRSGEAVHRRGFLRRLGTTLAIGAGVALVPASRALAIDSFSQCCPSGPNGNCPKGSREFQCFTNCPGGGGPCYVCSTHGASCFSQSGCICG